MCFLNKGSICTLDQICISLFNKKRILIISATIWRIPCSKKSLVLIKEHHHGFNFQKEKLTKYRFLPYINISYYYTLTFFSVRTVFISCLSYRHTCWLSITNTNHRHDFHLLQLQTRFSWTDITEKRIGLPADWEFRLPGRNISTSRISSTTAGGARGGRVCRIPVCREFVRNSLNENALRTTLFVRSRIAVLLLAPQQHGQPFYLSPSSAASRRTPNKSREVGSQVFKLECLRP
jgi:hypothetical protein